jgi:hypothetical protein
MQRPRLGSERNALKDRHYCCPTRGYASVQSRLESYDLLESVGHLMFQIDIQHTQRCS